MRMLSQERVINSLSSMEEDGAEAEWQSVEEGNAMKSTLRPHSHRNTYLYAQEKSLLHPHWKSRQSLCFLGYSGCMDTATDPNSTGVQVRVRERRQYALGGQTLAPSRLLNCDQWSHPCRRCIQTDMNGTLCMWMHETTVHSVRTKIALRTSIWMGMPL